MSLALRRSAPEQAFVNAAHEAVLAKVPVSVPLFAAAVTDKGTCSAAQSSRKAAADFSVVLNTVPAANVDVSTYLSDGTAAAAAAVAPAPKRRKLGDAAASASAAAAADACADTATLPRPLSTDERYAMAGLVSASTLHATLHENDELLRHLSVMRAAACHSVAEVRLGAAGAADADISTYLRPAASELAVGAHTRV